MITNTLTRLTAGTTDMSSTGSSRLPSPHMAQSDSMLSAAPTPYAHVEAAHPSTIVATVASAAGNATNRWLGGKDGVGCSGNRTAFGTKRIHPGRLGGVT